MSKKIVNKYVPRFSQYSELPWYERDGLLSYYIDTLKCEEFLKETDSHFKTVQVVNFDIIHHECRGDLLQGSYKEYQTINKKDMDKYSSNSKKKIVNSAIRSDRKEVFIDKKVTLDHFKHL